MTTDLEDPPQAVSERTEEEVTADVVWRLIQRGILSDRPGDVHQVCQILGLDLLALRDASARLAVPERYQPPRRIPCRQHPPPAPSRHRPAPNPGGVAARPTPTPPPTQADEDAAVLVGRVTNTRPHLEDGRLWCGRHDDGEGAWLDPEAFGARADRPGVRRSACRDCEAAYSRERYLDAERLRLLRVAVAVLDRESVHVGDQCARCRGPLRTGDSVVAVDVVLAHEKCPGKGTP